MAWSHEALFLNFITVHWNLTDLATLIDARIERNLTSRFMRIIQMVFSTSAPGVHRFRWRSRERRVFILLI